MRVIRKAKPEDIDQIYELICKLEEMAIDFDSFKEIYCKNMNNQQVHYYVCELNEDVVGFVSLHIQSLLHHAQEVGEIQELIVSDEMRGHGIGKEMFEKVTSIARDAGITTLEVTCNQKRQKSHHFYEQMGMNNSHYKFTMNL